MFEFLFAGKSSASPLRASFRPQLEGLEARALLSANGPALLTLPGQGVPVQARHDQIRPQFVIANQIVATHDVKGQMEKELNPLPDHTNRTSSSDLVSRRVPMQFLIPQDGISAKSVTPTVFITNNRVIGDQSMLTSVDLKSALEKANPQLTLIELQHGASTGRQLPDKPGGNDVFSGGQRNNSSGDQGLMSSQGFLKAWNQNDPGQKSQVKTTFFFEDGNSKGKHVDTERISSNQKKTMEDLNWKVERWLGEMGNAIKKTFK